MWLKLLLERLSLLSLYDTVLCPKYLLLRLYFIHFGQCDANAILRLSKLYTICRSPRLSIIFSISDFENDISHDVIMNCNITITRTLVPLKGSQKTDLLHLLSHRSTKLTR